MVTNTEEKRKEWRKSRRKGFCFVVSYLQKEKRWMLVK